MEGEIRGDRGEDPAQLSTAKPRERKGGGEEMHVMKVSVIEGKLGLEWWMRQDTVPPVVIID